jgi:hypothetical protein
MPIVLDENAQHILQSNRPYHASMLLSCWLLWCKTLWLNLAVTSCWVIGPRISTLTMFLLCCANFPTSVYQFIRHPITNEP